MDNPQQEYASRLESRKKAVDDHLKKERSFGFARLFSFLLGLLLLFLTLAQFDFPAWLILAPFAVFVVLLVLHDRMIRERRGLEQAVLYYEMELARVNHTWMGKGFNGSQFEPDKHPYAVDLDLFGKASLFEYLCRAKTPTGQRKLANWLVAKSEIEVLSRRQEAVHELSPNLDFQESLAQGVTDPTVFRDPEYFEAWMGMAPIPFGGYEKSIAYFLSLLSGITLVVWFGTTWGGLPFLASCILSGTYFSYLGGRVIRVLSSVEKISEGLNSYASLLERVETETFLSEPLVDLKKKLETDGTPASEEIRKLAKWVKKLEDGNRNVILFPFARLMFWSTHLAMAIEGWRERNGEAVLGWIDTLAEFETLSSLAAHAYSNPDNVFPEFEPKEAILEGVSLGHPLMDRKTCVRNSIRLTQETPLVIISGSNMSGKSTYMRTVGTNTVLALIGATVHASQFRVSPFRIAASIQIRDSLQEGISKFYQEILRVREMIDLSHEEGPLLFFIDEIFQGTNSHDRRIAAQSIMKKLVREGAMGLISTHDLALTQIAENLLPPGKNFHFEDRMEGDKMIFDYTMKEGVIEKGNALNLLRSIGLEVEDESAT
ncbi:MAG: DNA mismatch repair protein MutS [Candidatus Omnitrophica bacterium]|nr:DNA mismatch repair protein MutS [Candidatus Omnitrophota bacterium]